MVSTRTIVNHGGGSDAALQPTTQSGTGTTAHSIHLNRRDFAASSAKNARAAR